MSRSMRNALRMFSAEGVALLNEEQELIKNSLLKFKKCPYPNNESGWKKGYRAFISECENYLLLEDSEIHFKDNGHDGYRPNGQLKIWVKIDDRAKAWGVFDGIPYKEITSLPYNYVHDVEEAISFIERWEKTQEVVLSPCRESGIQLEDWWLEKDRFANPLPSFFVGYCRRCGKTHGLNLVTSVGESGVYFSKIMCKGCMTK